MGVRDIEMEPLPATWGRLAACAAAAYRRHLAPTCQLADCQSAAAYQAAPQQGHLPGVPMRSASRHFASESRRRPLLCCTTGGMWA